MYKFELMLIVLLATRSDDPLALLLPPSSSVALQPTASMKPASLFTILDVVLSTLPPRRHVQPRHPKRAASVMPASFILAIRHSDDEKSCGRELKGMEQRSE
jgi:hypothetical protein